MAEQEAKQTLITTDVEITGTVKSSSAIRMEGKLEGDMHCAADVVVGETARIQGNLNVNSITVFGQVHGNIVARERIELKPTARVVGDIKAKRLKVEDGVSFSGKSEVNPSGASIEAPAQRQQAAKPAEAQEAHAEAQRAEQKSGGGLFGRR